MKLLLHVGLHRAASTSLQHWLRSHKDIWARQGCLAVSGVSGPGATSPFVVLNGELLRQAGGTSAGDFVEAEMADLAQRFSRGIVSDENFLGPMPGGAEPAFSALDLLCAALRRMAQSHVIVPVIVLRQHAAWLRSVHNTQRLRGDHRPFPAFVAKVANGLAYSAMLDALAAATGQRPIVHWLEDIEADGGTHLTGEIVSALDVAPDGDRRLPPHNASQPELVLRLAAAFGRRKAMIAEAGSPGFANKVRDIHAQADNVEDRLVTLIEPRAICFPFALAPGLRATRAIALYRSGVPAGRLLPESDCRAAVREALQPSAPPGRLPADLTTQFERDMESLRKNGFGPKAN